MIEIKRERLGRFLPSEQNRYVMVQRVFVSFHVEFLLPLTEAAQAVVSMVYNLQVILFSMCHIQGREENMNQTNESNKQLMNHMWTTWAEKTCRFYFRFR